MKRHLLACVSVLMMSLALPVQAADTYQVDPVHSVAVYQIKHFGVGNFWGRFNGPGGTIVLDEQDPSKSSFEVVLKAENIDTGNQKRDDHLKSGDFFNAKQFPEIKFKSTSVKSAGQGKYEVTGDLTMLGVTKPMTVTVNQIGKGETRAGYRVGVETEFTVKRSDFGMSFMQGENALGDDVRMIVALEGVRQ